MGIDIRCNHKECNTFTVGAGIFMNLRRTVAKVIMKDDYHYYEEWLATDEDTPRDELHEKCKAFYEHAGDALYNFCVQSDIDGKLTYKQAKELYYKLTDEVLDGYNFSLRYYAFQKEENRLDFILMLKDCITYRCGFKWY